MSGPFLSIYEEILFWIILFSLFLVPGIPQRRRWRQFSKSTRRTDDKGSAMLITFGGLFSLAIAILAGYLRVWVLPSSLFYPGLILILLGMVIVMWADATLGRFYAPTVRVQIDHRVIDKGPYSLIRHPHYAAYMLGLVGVGLALQSSAALLVLLIGGGAVTAYRVRIEEKFLVAELGGDYVEYSKGRKRFIPYIL